MPFSGCLKPATVLTTISLRDRSPTRRSRNIDGLLERHPSFLYGLGAFGSRESAIKLKMKFLVLLANIASAAFLSMALSRIGNTGLLSIRRLPRADGARRCSTPAAI